MSLKSRHLFTMTTRIDPLARQQIGKTAHGHRVIVQVAEGRFEGDKLKGIVLPGARDWALIRLDGVMEVDVRLTLKTHDDALIYVTYTGLVLEARRALAERERGITPDPATTYFRTTPRFETGDERYAWLNTMLAVGVGTLPPDGVNYDIYEIL